MACTTTAAESSIVSSSDASDAANTDSTHMMPISGRETTASHNSVLELYVGVLVYVQVTLFRVNIVPEIAETEHMILQCKCCLHRYE